MMAAVSPIWATMAWYSAIDSLRERRVMSLRTRLGNLGNILDEDESQCDLLQLDSPVLTNAEFDALCKYLGDSVVEIACTFDPAGGELALKAALDRIQQEAEDAVRGGATHVVLSDDEIQRRVDAALKELEDCHACPRNCGVNRLAGETHMCNTGRHAVVSSAFAHLGEEPCLRGWSSSAPDGPPGARAPPAGRCHNDQPWSPPLAAQPDARCLADPSSRSHAHSCIPHLHL